jgi:hypothetical protein
MAFPPSSVPKSVERERSGAIGAKCRVTVISSADQ